MKFLITIVLCFVSLQNIDAGLIVSRSDQLDAEAKSLLKDLYYLRNVEKMSNKSPYETHKRETVQTGNNWKNIFNRLFSLPKVIYGRKQQWDTTYGK